MRLLGSDSQKRLERRQAWEQWSGCYAHFTEVKSLIKGKQPSGGTARIHSRISFDSAVFWRWGSGQGGDKD